jgi:hypothetical protein
MAFSQSAVVDVGAPPAWNGAQVFVVLSFEQPTERGFLVPVTNDQPVAPNATA